MLTKIWRYEPCTGYWALVRDSYPENVARWLEILRGDEPGNAFRAADKRPNGKPRKGESI